MSYAPNRETLELAALACGKLVYGFDEHKGVAIDKPYDPRHVTYWQPHLPTMQGKADLLDMIEAIPLDVEWEPHTKNPKYVIVRYWVDTGGVLDESVSVANGNNHAALMEAALKVAAMVGAKMKETTSC